MDAAQALSGPCSFALREPDALQGAVAHCDMPVESGPTLYLPHSQKYSHGYLAYWLPQFRSTSWRTTSSSRCASKGDLVFFSPALLHAAGSNVIPDIDRMANLLQISSAFGRSMEAVDRRRVVEAVYPVLVARLRAGWSSTALDTVIAASAEGYPFPTNLDRDQPVASMAPPTQADLVRALLAEQASVAELQERLSAQTLSKLSH